MSFASFFFSFSFPNELWRDLSFQMFWYFVNLYFNSKVMSNVFTNHGLTFINRFLNKFKIFCY